MLSKENKLFGCSCLNNDYVKILVVYFLLVAIFVCYSFIFLYLGLLGPSYDSFLIRPMEGALSALVMVVASNFAILFSIAGKDKPALVALLIAVTLFTARSIVSAYFLHCF